MKKKKIKSNDEYIPTCDKHKEPVMIWDQDEGEFICLECLCEKEKE